MVSIGHEGKEPVSLSSTPNRVAQLSADCPITSAGKLNINTASAQDLTLLSGIGEVLSQRIVAYREEIGKFQKVEDLIQVKGIGEEKLNKIIDYVAVE